ncbi:MAG: type IV pilus twitching motility protein PilT [Elusimicrobiota bacterium]
MDLRELLELMMKAKASDLHLKEDGPPIARMDGELMVLDSAPLSPKSIELICTTLMKQKHQSMFDQKHECDLAYTLPSIGRFRVNIFHQRGLTNLVFRAIPEHIPKFEDMHLPQSIKKLADNERGLVLVTGTTGCGKSTTLATMIDYINETRSCHIVTIEDPIEFIHKDKKSIISQREIGLDTLSYLEALKHVVRQDPDVILIGEMRDLETMAAALTAAQTGHLVLATIHTIDAIQTVTRIVDLFPPHQQTQIRYQLADTLKGVVSQRLLLHSSGKGRVPAVEVLVASPLVRKLIEENSLTEISNVIKQGSYYGMQNFNQALLKLTNQNLVTLEEALSAASNPEELMLAIRGIESN